MQYLDLASWKYH